MTKILVIAGSLQPGGAEKSAIKLARSLTTNPKYQVYFGTYFKSQKDFYEKPNTLIIDFGIETSHSEKFLIKLANVAKIIGNTRKVRKKISSEKIDLVISFGAGMGCLSFLYLLGLRIPQITSERISPDPEVYRPSPLARLMRPWIYHHGVICSVQSFAVKELVRKIWNIQAFVTPNHFDIPSETYSMQENSAPCIAIGRPDYQKGYDLLILAWSQIEKIHRNKLYIFSDDKNGYIKSLIDAANLKNVEIKSPSKDLLSSFKQSSLYISVSRFEGYPNATAEALIFGLPVLTSVSCDVVQQWRDNQLCMTFASFDPAEISEKISLAIQDKNLRERVSVSAVSKRMEFGWEAVQQYWIDIIDSAIASKNSQDTN